VLITLTLLAAVFATAAVLLGMALVSMHRRHHPRFVLPHTAHVSEDLPSLAGLTHGVLESGNHVELIENGDAYLAALESLAQQAQKSLHFETFLWKTGAMSDRVVSALERAAKRGVEVRVLLDGMGGKISDEERERLGASGAEHCILRPIGVRHLGWINNRTHRKILVADGTRAIVGGHCIDDRWLGDARNANEFRDVSALVTGLVVRQIQAAFCENWIEGTGKVPYGEAVFPHLSDTGDMCAHLAYMRPSGGVSSVKLLHHIALRLATERLWIQTPYFLPDGAARAAMIAAVHRGVDVRVLTPNIDASDNRLCQHASHFRLAPLLEHGIRVHHYGHTLLHQKVWTIDGEYALIGSTNFDERSFDLDDEVTLGVLDRSLVRKIDERFVADLARAELVDPARWRRRPASARVGDALAYLLREQL
jgi:cardiolipin synthase